MDKQHLSDRDYDYGKESMRWYGWGSPIGLGFSLMSVGAFLWFLHLANIIK